ncbi:tetratricopeptide repeat protein [Alienimonas californiensis]|uniref:Tetratricopeptide repeat protein n=1 Tax=Alienimonas californiensis TaxID=2527989 RepID=A0A517PCB7_9PLAN|nr:hypothetical protein [Alienimonas californiensis]QDT17002.1 hypothetical protein CA12_31120 [Alienimonas californiensis]
MFSPLALCLALPLVAAPDEPSPPAAGLAPVAAFLAEGNLAGAEAALNKTLKTDPGDDDALFSLGVVKFLGGIEEFAQFLSAHGSGDRLGGMLPFARLPVPANADPQPVSYEQWRKARIDLIAAFDEADAVLAKIDGPVDVKIDLAALRLDLNGDGTAGEAERVLSLLGAGGLRLEGDRSGGRRPSEAPAIVTHFDRADAEWLRGYCDLLSAILETMLAHDAENWWNHCAHLLFAQPEGVPGYLLTETGDGFSPGRLSDIIAAIHHVNFPVREPERMGKARERLLGMIGHSRAMWDLILAEEDGEREWIPGPHQTSSTGVTMSQERVDGWREFLAEAEDLLNGEKLVPFWRTQPAGLADAPNGVNLRRVFEEPRRFDLVEWVQGPGAAPFLERGELTSPAVWNRLQRLFNGNFFGFAVLIN